MAVAAGFGTPDLIRGLGCRATEHFSVRSVGDFSLRGRSLTRQWLRFRSAAWAAGRDAVRMMELTMDRTMGIIIGTIQVVRRLHRTARRGHPARERLFL